MCLWFDSCFGRNIHQDYGHEHADARARTTTYRSPARNGADHGHQRNGNQGQGYHGNGHTASYQTAADEAHNHARKDHALVAGAAATRDGHGYTAYAQDNTYSAAADEILKLPARNNKIGDDTGYKSTLLRAC